MSSSSSCVVVVLCSCRHLVLSSSNQSRRRRRPSSSSSADSHMIVVGQLFQSRQMWNISFSDHFLVPLGQRFVISEIYENNQNIEYTEFETKIKILHHSITV
ncbi:MAG: hypothetical protein GY738_09330 [Pseudoalteromonas sp.]|nr:hypothetical protein [Pseudoalteromonas sp.]